jgi:hypothetical protein
LKQHIKPNAILTFSKGNLRINWVSEQQKMLRTKEAKRILEYYRLPGGGEGVVQKVKGPLEHVFRYK